jgi:hypothetical protein
VELKLNRLVRLTPPAGDRMKNPRVRFGFDAWSLGLASSIIDLRTLKIAAGGAAANAESRRMLREKLEVGWDLQTKALTGALGLTPHIAADRTLAHYLVRFAQTVVGWQQE